MDGARTGVRGGPDASGDAASRRGHAGVRALTVLVIAAGRTGPNTALRFGAEASDLDETGRRDCARSRRVDDDPPADGVAWYGPEASVAQTAEAFGVAGRVAPGLRSLDLGRWRGLLPQDVPGDELHEWFTDTHSSPHGGESVADFVVRVGDWCDEHLMHNAEHAAPVGTTLVVAMPVVQALVVHLELGGPQDFWTVAVEPASRRVVTSSAGTGGGQGRSDRQK